MRLAGSAFGLGFSGLLFASLALTQSELSRPAPRGYGIAVSAPARSAAPPAVPAEPPSQPEASTAEPLPRLAKAPVTISLRSAEVSLNLTMPDSQLSASLDTRLPETDIRQATDPPFSLEDLSEVPRPLYRPAFSYPSELAQRGIHQGKVIVRIEINPQGEPRLLSIVSASHPRLKATAQEIVRNLRFTAPKANGKAVTARYELPLTIQNPA